MIFTAFCIDHRESERSRLLQEHARRSHVSYRFQFQCTPRSTTKAHDDTMRDELKAFPQRARRLDSIVTPSRTSYAAGQRQLAVASLSIYLSPHHHNWHHSQATKNMVGSLDRVLIHDREKMNTVHLFHCFTFSSKADSRQFLSTIH